MAAYSGQNGKVLVGSTTLAEITGWKFDPSVFVDVWASSTSPGFKKRLAGVKDATGSFDFKVDDTSEQWDTFDEGDSVTLKLYLDGTKFFTVPAIIDKLSFAVDINDGPAVTGTATFGSNGTYTYPA